MTSPIPKRQPAMGRTRHVHMVGIGGIGMSSIAEVLLRRGFEISGSDLKKSDVTAHLEELGARIHEGHDADQVRDADVVVYSSAVDAETNVETRAARERRIPVINRSIMLAELMRTKYGIGIAGTHGKTTTTTLTGLVVGRGGFDPTVVVGGKVAAFGSNAVIGEGDIIIVEADEYDRTFLRLTPAIAVITTVDEDHLDTYSDLDDIRQAFVEFAKSVPFFGTVVACIDDANVRDLLSRIARPTVTYGTSGDANLQARNVTSRGLQTEFEVWLNDNAAEEQLGRISLPLPGLHNVRNALAAVAVGLQLLMPFDEIAEALSAFAGIQRRFEKLADTNEAVVINDYAHHPREVAATLQAARSAYPDRRIVAVFQPHLYSRTLDLAADFGEALAQADLLVLAPIFGARESPVPGVSSDLIADDVRRRGHSDVVMAAERQAVPNAVTEVLVDGDAVIVMGAGDIWRSAHELAGRLSGQKDRDTSQ